MTSKPDPRRLKADWPDTTDKIVVAICHTDKLAGLRAVMEMSGIPFAIVSDLQVNWRNVVKEE